MWTGTFALLSAIELQNILDFRTYVFPDQSDLECVWRGYSESSMSICDVNAIPHEERLECIYTQGLALELASWIFTHFELISGDSSPTADPWDDFYWPFLAHITHAIQAYKTRYPDSVSSILRGSSLEIVKEQIARFSFQRPAFEKALKNINPMDVTSIIPPFPFETIHQRQDPSPFRRECGFRPSLYVAEYKLVLGKSTEEISSSGFRSGDRTYGEAYKEAVAHRGEQRRANVAV
jgi:hypothetical protein